MLESAGFGVDHAEGLRGKLGALSFETKPWESVSVTCSFGVAEKRQPAETIERPKAR